MNESDIQNKKSSSVKKSNERIPISEIPEDWDEGYKKGHPFWEKGEEARKAGNYEKAIELYNRARNNGYLAPALYKSYAMVYRKIKDKDGEIAILEEGIDRMKVVNDKKGNFTTGIRDLNKLLEKAKA